MTPQNRERIVDKYGSTAIAIIHTGDEVRVTVPWAEWAQATLNEIYDPGTDAGTSKGVGRSAGYIYTTQSMDIHADAAYRRRVARIMTERALQSARDRAMGGAA